MRFEGNVRPVGEGRSLGSRVAGAAVPAAAVNRVGSSGRASGSSCPSGSPDCRARRERTACRRSSTACKHRVASTKRSRWWRNRSRPPATWATRSGSRTRCGPPESRCHTDHIEHIYTKTRVSTRAAATRWAVEALLVAYHLDPAKLRPFVEHACEFTLEQLRGEPNAPGVQAAVRAWNDLLTAVREIVAAHPKEPHGDSPA